MLYILGRYVRCSCLDQVLNLIYIKYLHISNLLLPTVSVMQKEQPLTEIRLELNTCNYSESGTFAIYRQPSHWNLRYISTTFILQRSLYIDNLHTATFVTYRQPSYCNLRYISTTFILRILHSYTMNITP